MIDELKEVFRTINNYVQKGNDASGVSKKKAINRIARTLGSRNNIENMNRTASNSIAYFPMVFSDSVSIETTRTITKSFELKNTDMIKLVLANTINILDPSVTKQDIIGMFKNMDWITTDKDGPIFFEGAAAILAANAITNKTTKADILNESAFSNTAMLDGTNDKSLNGISTVYLTEADKPKPGPYDHMTTAELRRKKAEYDAILSASRTGVEEVKAHVESNKANYFRAKAAREETLAQIDAKNFERENKAAVNADNREINKENQRRSYNHLHSASAKDVKKVNELSPSILEVEVWVGTKGIEPFKTSIFMGVKNTIHVVKSPELMDIIVNSLTEEDYGLRIIQWFTGEISFFKDLLMNVKGMKSELKNLKNRDKLNLASMRRLTRFSRESSIHGGQRFNALASIVLTVDEVEEINNRSGINLTKPGDVEKLYRALSPLDFIIVDEASEVIHTFNAQARDFDLSKLSDEEKNRKVASSLLTALAGGR